jgi:hypothetical protein
MVPVAVKVIVTPATAALVAVMVFEPAEFPSVQLPTAAIPFAFDVADVPVAEPPPDATANVTATPLTGLAYASVTNTLGGTATAVFTVADCALPALIAIVVAAPAVPVAVNVTGLPESDPLVAVSELLPRAVPSVQLPTVAIPAALVVADAPVMLPPPNATANVTATPFTGFPAASFTITLGGVATAVFTVAD